jgi:hypothetical protein
MKTEFKFHDETKLYRGDFFLASKQTNGEKPLPVTFVFTCAVGHKFIVSLLVLMIKTFSVHCS